MRKKVPDYWNEACRDLAKRDKILKQLIAMYEDVQFRSRGSAFETLLRAIVGQQISVKAAQSVWGRFEALVGKVNPESLAEVSVHELRACGLSTQKVSYMKDLADHFVTGRINPRAFRTLDDDTLMRELMDVRGIGRWTAEMFLMFHLNRPDVYPVQDIGLIRAIERHYFGGEAIPKGELLTFGDRWRPWRSVATWYLWRSLDPFPVEY